MKRIVLFILVSLQMCVDSCDPDTQYQKDGVCCKMCGPGFRMNGQATCEDPMCAHCERGEYQSRYTRATRCELQPFCDPNLNLEQKELDPTVRVPCTCKPAHHCSSEECLTCVQNTVCEAGKGVYKEATQFNDTVCQPCGEGTFSNESSAVDECHPWKRCEEKTNKLKKSGTPTSDVECEERISNAAAAGYVSVAVVFVFVVLIGVFIFLKKDQFKKWLRDMRNKKHDDNDDPKQEPLVLLEEGLVPAAGHWPEEESLQHPVETEDPSLPHAVQAIDMTENDNPLRQEEGKADHAPVPELCMSIGHVDTTAAEPSDGILCEVSGRRQGYLTEN